MNRALIPSIVAAAVSGALLSAPLAQAQDEDGQSINDRLAELEAEIQELRQRNDRMTEELEDLDAEPESEDGISLGGAVRFQYIYRDWDDGNEDRGGDIEFDIFRLDLDGQMGDVILSAQYRWFEYMEALRHAWVGYNFSDEWQGQIGMVIQPFGVMPYNSHNYFFNSTFYMGMEDNPGAGVRFLRRTDDWDLDFAFIKNDELGGVSGSVRSKADRYNYNVVGIRQEGEGTFEEPNLLAGEHNTFMTRIARKWHFADDRMLELGFSGQYGDFHDGVNSIGDRENWGFHAVYETGPWEFHGQYATYDYDIDVENEGVIVGAYAYYDTIPTSADIYTGNVAYNMPVSIGPISHLQFYNNYSLITNKRGFEDDTYMNVTGVAVSAGGLYTYIDFVTAKNQPFIGGSVGEDGGGTNHRFNINFGYYF